MNPSTDGPEGLTPEDAATLDRLARDMVTALDGIAVRLLRVAPADGMVPLTVHEMIAARTIPDTGSITMSALANGIGVSLPAATHLVDRLVEKGIVARVRSDEDRRLVLVALTDKAQSIKRTFFENRVQAMQGILKPIAPDAREQVVKALRAVALVAETYPLRHAGRTSSA
jgi:DNA-binding MarR family transcriptional regulator